jgi:hypothetical protein
VEEGPWEPSDVWEAAVWSDAIRILQIRKTPARNTEGWRKEIGEAMARKWADAP